MMDPTYGSFRPSPIESFISFVPTNAAILSSSLPPSLPPPPTSLFPPPPTHLQLPPSYSPYFPIFINVIHLINWFVAWNIGFQFDFCWIFPSDRFNSRSYRNEIQINSSFNDWFDQQINRKVLVTNQPIVAVDDGISLGTTHSPLPRLLPQGQWREGGRETIQLAGVSENRNN